MLFPGKAGVRISIGIGAASLLALVASACGEKSREAGSAVPKVPANGGGLDRGNFDDTSTTVDNKYFPLKPGTQYVYEGYDLVGGERTPHRVVFTVTDLVKKIDGVRTVVIWDRDFTGDDLEEAELTFFAQDKGGTVWHFGQYREEWDGNTFNGGQAWLVGHLKGAKAGIFMKAHPEPPGTPSYSEGYAPPPVYWTDRARTSQMGVKTKVPAGSYENVLVLEEFNAEEPDAIQLKYYAPGVGSVRVGWRGDDTEQQETLELVEFKKLSPAEQAKARAEALKLETRANVYGSTPAAERRPDS